MRYLNKIDYVLSKIEKVLVVIFFSVLVVLIAFNIVSRNLFDSSFQKILEFSPALVLWLALLGASLALQSGRHIKLELLLRFCPEKIRLTAVAAASVFGMAVMLILGIASVEFVKNEIALFGMSGIVAAVFPLFFTVGLFRYFLNLADSLQNIIFGSTRLTNTDPDEMVRS